jgi:hypothetical protein
LLTPACTLKSSINTPDGVATRNGWSVSYNVRYSGKLEQPGRGFFVLYSDVEAGKRTKSNAVGASRSTWFSRNAIVSLFLMPVLSNKSRKRKRYHWEVFQNSGYLQHSLNFV